MFSCFTPSSTIKYCTDFDKIGCPFWGTTFFSPSRDLLTGLLSVIGLLWLSGLGWAGLGFRGGGPLRQVSSFSANGTVSNLAGLKVRRNRRGADLHRGV